MELTASNLITFNTTSTPTVGDVAISLVASEKLLKHVGGVLEEIFPGISVEVRNVEFQSATSASPLRELLLASLWIAYQDDLETELPKIIKQITGQDVPEGWDTVLTIIFLVLVVYGLSYAWKKVFGNDDKATKDELEGKQQQVPRAIVGDYNTIVSVAGDYLGVEPERITDAVDRSLNGNEKRWVASAATKFVQPAKNENGADIEGAGSRITAEAIAEAPSGLSEEDELPEEKQTFYGPVTVHIHATDLDKTKQGWAGHIENLVPDRVPMQLAPFIDTASLFGKRAIQAEVVVFEKLSKIGSYVPYKFFLLKVID